MYIPTNSLLRITALLLVFVFNNILLFGQEIQNSSNIWYFGDRSGLDFNTDPPTALTNGQIDTQEGVASISNDLGVLMFYTDGVTIWDRNHEEMPNAAGILNGHASSTQSAIILPHPGAVDLFYVFTVDELGGGNGLSYSIVDMKLPGNGSLAAPLGNVTSTELNIQLASPITEKIVGIVKPNNSGYWVIAHGWNSNEFYTYNVSCSGINETPIISKVGNVHTGGNANINAVGYMKSTIDGKKLALVNRNSNSVDVYDFNLVTGTVSNEFEIYPNVSSLYGIEFSSSGEYLFIGGTDEIKRYSFVTDDLTDVVIDDNAPFSGTNGVRALQMGPDENIYVSLRNWNYIGVIYSPNENNPVLTTNGIYLDLDNIGRHCRFGLPNNFYFDLHPADSVFLSACENELVEYNGDFYPAGSTNEIHLLNASNCDSLVILRVEEFELAEKTLVFETCEGSFITFDGNQIQAGTEDTFIYIDENGCDSTINVIVNEVDIIEEDLDILLCEGETYFYNNEAYSIGTDTIFQFIDQFGCENIVALKIELSPPIEFELIPENACLNMDNGSLSISNILGGIPPFEFSEDGQSYFPDTIINNLASSTYNIYVRDSNLCVYIQASEISETPEIEIEYSDIIISCDEDSVLLVVNPLNFEVNEVDWEWSNGSTDNFLYVSEPQVYSLELSNHCQILVENIQVELEEYIIEELMYIPNIFSPNDDGLNDAFKLFPVDDLEFLNYEIHIFNRWGEMVFQSYDIKASWDGSFKGQELNSGVYAWFLIAEAIACKRDIAIFERGDITIIR